MKTDLTKIKASGHSTLVRAREEIDAALGLWETGRNALSGNKPADVKRAGVFALEQCIVVARGASDLIRDLVE